MVSKSDEINKNDKKTKNGIEKKKAEQEFDFSGHRKRLKDFYVKNGMDMLKDYEILELILFYAIPRKDTRAIARRLLNKYGSLSAVMDAGLADLCEVDGIGENAAILLKLVPDTARQYMLSSRKEKQLLDTNDKIRRYLEDYFIGRTVECFYMLCLDNAGRLIRCTKMAEGEPDNVNVNTKKVGLEIALSGAKGIVIAHNHPQGLPLPSKADVDVTEKISGIARELGSSLIDHIIYSPTEAFSMANSKRFYKMFFLE